MIGTGQVQNRFRPYLFAVALIASVAALMLLLAGCTKPPPAEPSVYVTSATPEIPVECEMRCPAEPKVPDDDIDDLGAVDNRSALKDAYRCERHARAMCRARLKVLLPRDAQ